MRKNIALNYLEKNIMKNILLIHSIKRDTADIIYAEKDGVIIQENINKTYMISMENSNKAEKILENIDNILMYTIMNRKLAKDIIKKYNLKTEEKCINALYLKEEKLENRLEENEEIINLDMGYLKDITDLYKVVDEEYIKWELENNKIFGIFEDGNLAGFIAEHKEGSIGILEIFENYRNRKLGTKLLKFMVNRALDNGYIPFSQIYTDNEISKNLHKKLGFTVDSNYDNINYWIH